MVTVATVLVVVCALSCQEDQVGVVVAVVVVVIILFTLTTLITKPVGSKLVTLTAFLPSYPKCLHPDPNKNLKIKQNIGLWICRRHPTPHDHIYVRPYYSEMWSVQISARLTSEVEAVQMACTLMVVETSYVQNSV